EVPRRQAPAAAPAGESLPREELLARLRWRYPHAAACAAPAKVTATQAAALEEEPGALLVREEESPAFQRPQFAQAALGLTAAQRGTAVHQVMQTIRLDRAAAPAAVAQELARLTQQAFLTPEQAAAVDPGEVAAFFASSLGEAVRGAAELHREYPFSVLAPAERFLPDAPAGEEVLLQGVVDCWFATEEGITLVDFKTDRISPQGLEVRGQRYRGQMAAYAYALEEVTGRPVTRRVLWFLHLGRGLEMP
ncbi:PD-(D/E)XK nuclease family protein, partial [Evtepia sp.]